MSEHRYDPTTIEPNWQAVWEEEQTWHVSNDDEAGRPKSYVLEMLPYPSGEPHMGHLKNYAVGDAVAHFHRRTGRRVLHPMGYDAFGLPAENHAIKTGEHPRDSTAASIAQFQKQFREWGISIDWSREFATSRAALLPLDPVDLPAAVRARPGLPQGGRGQLVPEGRDRARQRAGDRRPLRALRHARSRSRQLEQWFFRITDYADRLLDDLADIDWPRARRDDAAQLDRPLRGRRGHVPLRGARARLRGLHHAAGHAVRRDVLRHGAGAPRRAAAGRGDRARGGGPRLRQPRRSPRTARSAATCTTRRRASRSAAR